MKTPSQPFINGFLSTAAALLVLNVASYVLLRVRVPGDDSGVHLWSGTAGFPVPFYEYSTGYYVGFDGFVIAGVVVDYVFVLAVALGVGVCCHRLCHKNR